MHDSDDQKVIYINCETHGPCDWTLDPRGAIYDHRVKIHKKYFVKEIFSALFILEKTKCMIMKLFTKLVIIMITGSGVHTTL